MREQLQFGRVVRERRRDDFAVELVVLVAADAERPADHVEPAAHVPPLAAKVEHLTPRIEVGLSFFDKRNPVVRLIVRIAAAEVPVRGRVGEPHFGESCPVERVGNIALRRTKVAGAPAAGADVQRDTAIADGDVASSASSPCAGSRVKGERSGRDRRPARSGISFVMTLTRPPMALAPYSRVAGPRTTSMRDADAGLTLTPWSPDWLDRSPIRRPSSTIRTRSPSRPRTTGRAGPGPKLRSAIPGWFSIVAPSVGSSSFVSSWPPSTLVA